MISEWRCKEDGVLLAMIQDGQLEIHYKEVAYTIEGVRRIKARCRKCGTENVLKPRINTN
jgi:hypothetical protein